MWIEILVGKVVGKTVSIVAVSSIVKKFWSGPKYFVFFFFAKISSTQRRCASAGKKHVSNQKIHVSSKIDQSKSINFNPISPTFKNKN